MSIAVSSLCFPQKERGKKAFHDKRNPGEASLRPLRPPSKATSKAKGKNTKSASNASGPRTEPMEVYFRPAKTRGGTRLKTTKFSTRTSPTARQAKRGVGCMRKDQEGRKAAQEGKGTTKEQAGETFPAEEQKPELTQLTL